MSLGLYCCARKNCLCWLVAFQRQKRRSVQIKHARKGISPLVRCERGRGRGGWVSCVCPCRRASMPNEGGAVVFGSRGPRASRFEGGCSVSRNRGQALHSPSRPAFLRARKTRSSSPPLPRWEEEEEKKRRSLAHRNVGRAGSRGPHHTTPRRLDRHSGVLPPRYPLSLSVLYSPLPCPGFDLPRCLVLRFLRSRVFWLLRCWAPSRLPNTQKKFEQTMTTTLLRPQPKISKIEKTKFPNGNIGIFFSWPRARARERSTSLRAP